MPKYTHNHYVPQLLLQQFKNDDGKLFYFDKAVPHKQVEHRNTKSIFYEKNLYIAKDAAGVRDDSLERDKLSKLENEAAPIIEKIISQARHNRVPNLTRLEKATWDEFLYNQWRRTPDFQQAHLTKDYINLALSRSIAEFEALYGPLAEEKRLELTSGKASERLIHNSKIMALKAPGDDVLVALSSKGIGVARPAESGNNFIIGSLPVVKLTFPQRGNLLDPTTEVWLPIARDVVVGIWGTTSQEKIVEIDPGNMRALNEQVYSQSTEIAGPSKEQIESFARIFRKAEKREPDSLS